MLLFQIEIEERGDFLKNILLFVMREWSQDKFVGFLKMPYGGIMYYSINKKNITKRR